MYHILKRVDYGERTYSVYHSSSTHTLEEAQMILDELNKLYLINIYWNILFFYNI